MKLQNKSLWGVPVYPYPAFLISYVTIVQYQNQETNIGTIY